MEMLKPLLIGIGLSALILFFLNSLMKTANAADTNTVSSTVVTDKSVPTANAPSVVVNNSDICKVATSGAIQTNILGLATGVVVDDELCQLLKLSRQLYASGLKVASISLLATDPRVFDSLVMAGTPPPYMGSIGSEALEKWKSNPNMIPEGSTVFEDTDVLKINVNEDVNNDDFAKFIIAAMALYIGFPILF